MDKSLKLDLLDALCDDLRSKNNFTQEELTMSSGELTTIEGLELILSGVETDNMCPINLTAKFFMDFACDREPLIRVILNSDRIDNVVNKKTLLMWAAERGYFNVIKVLILNGVDIKQVVNGRIAFDYAYENGYVVISWLFFKLGCHLTDKSISETETLLQEMPAPVGFSQVLAALA